MISVLFNKEYKSITQNEKGGTPNFTKKAKIKRKTAI
jgi:hypothetical protein